MRYRRFGKTELEMPVFSCGGMRYQHKWNDIDWSDVPDVGQKNLEATIHRAVDLGINHIETARGYGSSEMQLGPVLKQFSREKLIVQTKVAPYATAKEFLETLLIDGPCTVSKIQEEAKNAAHSWATVRRAKRSLGLESKKQGLQGPWVWQLPTKMLTDPEDAHPTDVSTFGENEHLRAPDDDLQQTITDLLSRHPKGLSNEDVAVILKVPLIKVEAVRGDHG